MTGRTVALAVLMVLSGCQFVGGAGGAGGSTPTPTATPAPVPTVSAGATDTPDRFDLPPGVSRRGVTEVGLLSISHFRAVVGTSYAWSDRQRSQADTNASAITTTYRRVRVVNGTRYAIQFSERRLSNTFVRDTQEGVERFADGERRYSRYRVDPSSSAQKYTSIPAINVSAGVARVAATSVDLYLDLPNATVSAVRLDGERHYRISARRDTYRAISAQIGKRVSARNYTVRAVVSPEGFVKRLNVSYTATGNGVGSPVVQSRGDRVHYSFTYRQIGTATVEPPDWLDEAREYLTAASERSGDDDTRTTPDPPAGKPINRTVTAAASG